MAKVYLERAGNWRLEAFRIVALAQAPELFVVAFGAFDVKTQLSRLCPFFTIDLVSASLLGALEGEGRC